MAWPGVALYMWVGWVLLGWNHRPLAPIVHGVARDGHGGGHGDGWAAHGELVGYRVVGAATAGALLPGVGSWETGEKGEGRNGWCHLFQIQFISPENGFTITMVSAHLAIS